MGTIDLLTVEEVADYLRVTAMTVYRWCWDGKLAGIKIGKEWRIARQDLEAFLSSRKSSIEPPSLEQLLKKRMAPPEHILVMDSNPANIYRLQAQFLQVGLAAGRPLFAGAWWQRPAELRSHLTAAGLPVKDLEAEGKMVIGDLQAAYQAGGVEQTIDVWRTSSQSLNGQTLWGTGSHRLSDWTGRLDELMHFETVLHNAFHAMPVVALCPCLLDPVDRPGFDTLLNLVPHHSAVLLSPGDQPMLLRASN